MIAATTTQVGGVRLRPYQTEAIAASAETCERGVRRQLLVLPTGCGKTVVFSDIVGSRGGRAVVLVHRDELVLQAVTKLQVQQPGRVGVVKAEADDVGADVVVASVQTLAHERRLARMHGPYRTVIVDEAHHAAAPTYRRVLDDLVGDDTLLLGVTATPGRGDGVGLADVFDEVIYRRTLPEMISAGYLADLRAVQVQVEGLDLDRVASRGGDWSDGDLGDALAQVGLPDVVRRCWASHAAGRRGLVFTPNVALAHATADALTADGWAAEAVDASTHRDDRRAILNRLHTGATQVVANCGVLTEGFDEPALDATVMARPTRSQSLYLQCIGRGTRTYPGKNDCLIVDLVGATTRHDLVTLAGLAGSDLESVARRGVTAALTDRPPMTRQAGTWAGELDAREVNLFRRRPMAWVLAVGRWILPTGAGTVSLEPAGGTWDVIERPRNQPALLVAGGLSLKWAQGVGEDLVRSRGAASLARADAPWRQRPASAKQLDTLKKMRIPHRPEMTAGEASDLISARIARRAA